MMLCRARPRLRVSLAALVPSSILATRLAGGSRNANLILNRPAAAPLACPSQTAFFSNPSPPKLPKMDLSSFPMPDEATMVRFRSDAHCSTVDPPPPNKKTEEGTGSALGFESPAWLAMASDHESHRKARTPVIDMTKIKRRGSAEQEREDARDSLQAILEKIDPRTEILHIIGDAPSNQEWEVLAHHFTSVRFLKVATGWEENWDDDKFPLNWPLELLVIADSVGERITTPAIMEGRIQNLVLLFTAGLRFEGPVTAELMKNAEQLDFYPRKRKEDAEIRAETEPSDSTPSEADGTPSPIPAPGAEAENPEPEETKAKAEPDGIKAYSVPYEWSKWINNHYEGKAIVFSPEAGDASPPSSMRDLQILGNDALQMLSYIALAKFHLLSALDSLTVYSPDHNDLLHIPHNIPLLFLPLLDNLTTLKLTLGSAMYAKLAKLADNEPFLHAFLPPNVEVLRFRGPVSMAPHLDEFAAAFDYEVFLPRLKKISFVLDLPDKGSNFQQEPSPDQLREAHLACRKLLDAAATKRGAMEEVFREPWVEEHAGLFYEVDNRWGVLNEMARCEEGGVSM